MDEFPTRFDLNLVRTFVAIYETKSVTQAAERLNLTQPTISHALSRLRDLYGDRLFSRGSPGLVPTAIAERVYEHLSVALTAIEGTVDARSSFEPLTSTRRFRIALSDIGSPVMRFENRRHRIADQEDETDHQGRDADHGAQGSLDLSVHGDLQLPSDHYRRGIASLRRTAFRLHSAAGAIA